MQACLGKFAPPLEGAFAMGTTTNGIFDRNKDVNSWPSWIHEGGLYNKFAPPLEGAFAMGTTTMALIQTC